MHFVFNLYFRCYIADRGDVIPLATVVIEENLCKDEF